MIPEAVARELERRPNAPGGGVPSLGWIERRNPDAGDVRTVASESPALDTGEREAIALALGMGARVVLDDLRGRRRARNLAVPVTGTPGVLLALRHAGRSHRRFLEDLDALEDAGMYPTSDLKRRVVERLRADDAPRSRDDNGG